MNLANSNSPRNKSPSGIVPFSDFKTFSFPATISVPNLVRSFLPGQQVGMCLPRIMKANLFGNFADHLHRKLKDDLQLPKDCVIHSFRHTFRQGFGSMTLTHTP